MSENKTSPLLRNIVAGLRKKGQIEEFPEHEETDIEQVEERAEIDIVADMKAAVAKIEDEVVRGELEALITEMAALHGLDKDLESVEEITEGEEEDEAAVEELGEVEPKDASEEE